MAAEHWVADNGQHHVAAHAHLGLMGCCDPSFGAWGKCTLQQCRPSTALNHWFTPTALSPCCSPRVLRTNRDRSSAQPCACC